MFLTGDWRTSKTYGLWFAICNIFKIYGEIGPICAMGCSLDMVILHQIKMYETNVNVKQIEPIEPLN